MKSAAVLTKSTLFILLICTASLLLAAGFSDKVDEKIRLIRQMQNTDGSYGPPTQQQTTTSLVLASLASSHRRYTDADGPFVRNASLWLRKRFSENGSVAPATSEVPVESTGLAVWALAQVNKSAFKKEIEDGKSFLLESIDSIQAGKTGTLSPRAAFTAALAFSASSPEILPELLLAVGWNWDNCHGDEGAMKAAALVLAGRTPPQRISSEILKELVSGKNRPPMAWLAACTFYSTMEKRGKPHPRWAAVMADHLEKNLQNADARELATVILCLSLCDRSKTLKEEESGPPPGAFDEPSYPPMVAAPLPLEKAMTSARSFLDASQKDGRFGFMGFADPGITAMALSAVIRSSRGLGVEPPPYLKEGLGYLKSLKKDDGSIYLTGLKTYVTSVALMAFQDSGDPAFAETIRDAAAFLTVIQADEGEGYSMEEDIFYGGMGYGGDERPDLSNTQMSLDALRAAGLDEDHEAFQKALNFIKKCQNLSEVNPTEVILSDGKRVVAGNDGGGTYYPGNSKAGVKKIDDGVYVARSYGSMTYALLKSLIFTGLDKDDRRVRAAVKWIENNYTLDENPGFDKEKNPDAGQQGLFYYYMTLARALDALEGEIITDSKGKQHPWRKELRDRILSIQRVDGSWINERSPRWFEGNPVLATSYALLALDICGKE